MAFTAGRHLLYKAVEEAGIVFPASKKDIAGALAGKQLRTGENTYTDAGDFIEKFPVDYFENASAFWCAYTSVGASSLKAAKTERKRKAK